MADQRKGLGERVGNEAHDATDTGNPLKVGGHANAALRSAVGEDDRVDLSCDLAGQVRVINDVSTPLFVVGEIAHDAASSGNPLLMGGHANASLPSAVGENDRVRASYDLQGQLRVIATGSTGGTSAVDDSVFTGGSTNLTPMGAIFDATPPTVTDGSVGTPLMTSGRILRTEVEQGTAASLNAQVVGELAHNAVDSGNPIKIGGKATTTPPGGVANNDRVDASYTVFGELRTETIGNVAHDVGDSGPPVKIGGRARTGLDVAVATNDRVNAVFTTTGGLLAAGVDGAVPRDIAVNASGQLEVDIAAQQTGDVLTEPKGNVAHNAVDSGNPIKIGGKATTTPPGGVANNDRVDASYTVFGELRTESIGNKAHDAADAGNPVKIGGRARTGLDVAVATNDRVDAVFSTTGGLVAAGIDVTTPRNIAVNASGQLEIDIAAQQSADITVAQATAASFNAQVVGNIASDTADAGPPVKIGHKAVEFNTDPPTVDTDDDRTDSIATPQGMQWVIGGHPNIISREYMTTAVQTVDPIIDSISPGSQIVITEIEVLTSAAGSTTPKVRIGFGTSAPPTEPTSGNTVDEVVLAHPGIAAGSGVVRGNGSGIVAIGADGAELRIANDVPTGGQITVLVNYYISTL